MAENADGQERSEEPTGKRLSDARSKGQIPRSRELSTLLVLLASAGAFFYIGPQMLSDLIDLLSHSFTISRSQIFDSNTMFLRLQDAVVQMLEMMAPFVLLITVVGVAASAALGGFVFSTQALAPKLSKLNPISGLKRVFGWRGLVEVVKGLAKVSVVGGVGFIYVYANADALLGLGREPLSQGLTHMGSLILWAFIVISLALIVVAAVDVPFQLWDHKRQLKMTKQEVKDERKQTDGNPEIKGRQRRIQMEMAQRRMMEEVPKADVLVTNPSHYAVALRYTQDEMDAPVLVAKGVDDVALNIRKVASAHDVPIMEAPPLARALYHSTELNYPIPEGLYRAVAQVLAYVYQLRQGTMYGRDGRSSVTMPEDLPIPDELRRDD